MPPASSPQIEAGSPTSSWGQLSREPHRLQPVNDRDHPGLQLAEGGKAIAYGNGRSYGDVCLNPGGTLWTTRALDRFIAFDVRTGVLECEAGVLLDEIISVALPKGWFLPVTPGTRFVTVGGAIANDVHGKNHHRAGSFGEHVLAITLARSGGELLECSPSHHADWLAASIGGLGLTGVIVRARLQLAPVPGPWMRTETLPYQSLDEFFDLSTSSEPDWAYAVSWVDCTGGPSSAVRGLFFRGNHAVCDAPPPRPGRWAMPLTPPVPLVNKFSLRAFNAAYYGGGRRRRGARLQHLLPFFYPLDAIAHWNRIYGRHGFYQYQCVLPRGTERDATAELMKAIRGSGQGSFLAVLKTFGERPGAGMMSFPMPGTTFALDFPNAGPATTALFARLDGIVGSAAGRLYPAKDARMDGEFFRRGYPRWREFLAYHDPAASSAMSRRLLGV